MVEKIVSATPFTVLCNIYEPRFEDPVEQNLGTVSLPIFNDCIIEIAHLFHLPVIDLNAAFSDPVFYTAEIEPSGMGGAKIAELIQQVVVAHDFSLKQTFLYP